MKKITVFELSDGSIEKVESVAIKRQQEIKLIAKLDDYIYRSDYPSNDQDFLSRFMSENINQLRFIFDSLE